MIEIDFTVNGQKRQMSIKPSLLLIDLIRDGLTLKGTKPGCNEGECGACTVLIDGATINSCLYPAVNIDGKDIVTIEGLPNNGESLEDVQKAMIKNGAVQCGFCSPGMIMAIKSFHGKCVKNNIVPDRELIKKELEGNLCRCTGYVKIIEAVEELFEN